MASGIWSLAPEALKLQSLHVSTLACLSSQSGVVEAVLVDHGGHALNAEVSLHEATKVQDLSSWTPSQTGAPPLLLAPPVLRLLLGEVQPLQLGLQLAGEGSESGPLPRQVGGGSAGQQRLRAGLIRPTRRRPPLLPPPP